MSADPANLAAKGAAALSSQDYPAAISYYSQAIERIPTSVDYYIKRSTAYQRASSYSDALSDAEIAVVLAQRKGNRDQLSTSQLRRGIALLLMQQYGDAGACFSWAEKYNEKDKSIPFWQKKLEVDLSKLLDDDDRREVTVTEIPNREIPKPSKPTSSASASKSAGDSGRVEELPDDYEEPKKTQKVGSTPAAVEPPKPAVPAGVSTPADKIRHEWYQTANSVTISLFVKGVPKESTTVELESNSLSITFPLPSGADFSFTLDPLFATINPSTSYYKILGTKVEFTLQKVETNKKWASLESTTEPASGTPTSTSTAKREDKPPVYPTSSKTGPKNWDKVVDDLAQSSKKSKTASGEKENQDDDNVDYADLNDDEFSADPVNGFFKKLYKDADPDTRRAMMKSYVESNGTALSTNWGEVGRGKVETSPPDGMEAKKW
ncbi:hypothetical protein TWF106_011250 [Orbilia oligospora]|uniref:SGS-domain-containing protein n=1 Tax=Orbilia oligospora TaxID=2813651 RepID=A0A6G1MHX9_ORBOL|nr:hypothetical protein TWF788_002933 [Orbilia oligospora]KAF3202295.1 hypothetical protein TWF679_010852 [Orbilia oligospora]KAF3226839.1 hypothetical protein TWF106_011250 [Orbilia oligospora]KAF3258298.1 hypothetical protein TWF192_000429 [Orbilia oligospora]